MRWLWAGLRFKSRFLHNVSGSVMFKAYLSRSGYKMPLLDPWMTAGSLSLLPSR